MAKRGREIRYLSCIPPEMKNNPFLVVFLSNQMKHMGADGQQLEQWHYDTGCVSWGLLRSRHPGRIKGARNVLEGLPVAEDGETTGRGWDSCLIIKWV